MSGVIIQVTIVKGWIASAIYILQTTSDPSVKNLSVASFMFVQNVINTLSSFSVGKLSAYLKVNPISTPHQYGDLITLLSVGPCIMSIPFFIISGLKMRKLLSEDKEEEPLLYRRLTMKIADDFVIESEENPFADKVKRPQK